MKISSADVRRTVPVRIVADVDLNPQPGNLEPRYLDGVLHGFGYVCVGCGLASYLPVKPEAPSGWSVVAGNPSTGEGLSLMPSLWHQWERCGWHGFLTAGVFVPLP